VQVPKIIGADIELGNFLLGVESAGGTGALAARALLDEFDGVPSRLANRAGALAHGTSPPRWDRHARFLAADEGVAEASTEWGRKYLPASGAAVYIDSAHLEAALSEVRDAWSHVAGFHGMLRLVQRAQRAAAARLPDGITLQVLANTTDGLGASYGAHLDFLIATDALDDILDRKVHYLAWLAAFQVSAIAIAGQGKVGTEPGRPDVEYQISQRADFFDRLTSIDTMTRRGIVNRRREPHCGDRSHLARLHVIFFDNMLAHVARLVTVGAMQIVLSMLEAGAVNPALMLESPLVALHHWSRDPSLDTTAALVGGRRVTIVELQRLFFDDASRFVAGGGCEGFVPRAAEIVAQWGRVLDALERHDRDVLARTVDWAAKLAILERTLERHPHLTWRSPQIKILDHLYASLGADGLYLAAEAAGEIDRVVGESEIVRAAADPPDDTRAWTRAMLLRRWGHAAVAIDWDCVAFEIDERWSSRRFAIVLDDPARFTRRECAAIVDHPDLEFVVMALEALRRTGAADGGEDESWTSGKSGGRRRPPA
jgi:proteasome accessory factor A